MSKLLFSYDGAIGVKQFWMGLLGGLATTMALAAALGLIMGLSFALFSVPPYLQERTIIAASVLIAAYAIMTQLAVTIKRCHDRGRSGWWCLLTLVPFVGLAWVVFDLGMTPGLAKPVESGKVV
jgi:uncharacterized membrane protein YhaH (DUF805 family)